MNTRIRVLIKLCSLIIIGFISWSFLPKQPQVSSLLRFPFKEAGLSEHQAAAHLLSRLSFGATQGEVDHVVKQGLEAWFTQQIEGGLPDDSLQARLSSYDALHLTNVQINEQFPRPIQVIRMARKEGIVPKDSANDDDRKKYKKEIALFIKEKNFRRHTELFRQFISAKIVKAAYSNNQLEEVLVDFWFNHFNVSMTKKDCSLYIPAYERDVIRPNVTGKFEDLLLATAKSPAMLLYLDNFNSMASDDDDPVADEKKRQRMLKRIDQMGSDTAMVQKKQKKKKNTGLNENYAREVMELHTLGVDGGYTQSDVTQAARILTGWTIYPMENGDGGGIKKIIDKVGEDKLTERGYVHDGDFLFAMDRHDRKEKTVMNRRFPANGGYQEGVELLKMLANHPSTAAFICRKMAIRFVSDDPQKSLVDKMAKTFLNKGGDLKEVMITMVSSPEFWSKEAIRNKTKSPFELAISAVRVLDADVQQPYQLVGWIEKMGQKLYHYQAPTGFPDKAQYWINTGALLNRMNFGLAMASKQTRGIKTNLLALNDNHEPESPAAALLTYGKLLLPERDLTGTIRRLTPLLTQPSLDKKLETAAEKTPVASVGIMPKTDEAMMENDLVEIPESQPAPRPGKKPDGNTENMLTQVVGIIIGSPEFQRK